MDLPPSQIVPSLTDMGVYLGSESSFYSILHAAKEQHHRGRSLAPIRRAAPTSYCANRPNQIWSWDITYLRSPVRGTFYYLYLILDIYSRKIVGWEVHEIESSEHAANLMNRTVLGLEMHNRPKVLHADNGGPMKGSALRVTLQRLGIEPSYSRPRVSNDNAYSESLFKTCKYRVNYPVQGFASIEIARDWVAKFTHWYNNEHRHSNIQFVTPNERHEKRDTAILAQRKALYELAKSKHPKRWSGKTRNWDAPQEVWLNPDKACGTKCEMDITSAPAAH